MITKRNFILRGSFFVISIILLSGNELHSIETLLQQLVRALKLTTLTLWQHVALSTAHEPRPVLIRCIDFS